MVICKFSNRVSLHKHYLIRQYCTFIKKQFWFIVSERIRHLLFALVSDNSRLNKIDSEQKLFVGNGISHLVEGNAGCAFLICSRFVMTKFYFENVLKYAKEFVAIIASFVSLINVSVTSLNLIAVIRPSQLPDFMTSQHGVYVKIYFQLCIDINYQCSIGSSKIVLQNISNGLMVNTFLWHLLFSARLK